MHHQNTNPKASFESPEETSRRQAVEQVPLPPFMPASFGESTDTSNTQPRFDPQVWDALKRLRAANTGPETPIPEENTTTSSIEAPSEPQNLAVTLVLRPRTPQQQSQKYPCPSPYCAWTFLTTRDLLDHARTVHADNLDIARQVIALETEQRAAKVRAPEEAANRKDINEKVRLEEAAKRKENEKARLEATQAKRDIAAEERKLRIAENLEKVVAIRRAREAKGILTCSVGVCLTKLKKEDGRKKHERWCRTKKGTGAVGSRGLLPESST